jgi:hypothetical protein
VSGAARTGHASSISKSGRSTRHRVPHYFRRGPVSWLPIALLGGAGGAIAWLLAIKDQIHGWIAKRSYYRDAGLRPPGFTAYIDCPAQSLAMLTKIVLGVIAASIFRDQVELAIGVGAAGPEMLVQFVKGFRDEGSTGQSSREVEPDPKAMRNGALRYSERQPNASHVSRLHPKRSAKYQPAHRKTTSRASMFRRPRET